MSRVGRVLYSLFWCVVRLEIIGYVAVIYFVGVVLLL